MLPPVEAAYQIALVVSGSVISRIAMCLLHEAVWSRTSFVVLLRVAIPFLVKHQPVEPHPRHLLGV